jgi:pSer/pThr/pTyr-binding forkhead associated (FHA) protein
VSVLVVTEGPLAGRRIELDGELVIGREDAGLTIDDEELSRRHAVVRVVGGSVEIEDLGSRNGTFVNGQRVDGATRLSSGDSLKVGRSVFAIELPRSAETVASPVAATTPVATPATSAPGVPREAFGAHAAPAAARPRRGIASRQLLPMLLSWGAVAATAAALIVYFAYHR